jgi:succinoglycan biosynthesis protein ExoO
MIRTDTIRELGLRYDESLRIGEDYHFLIRLMARGYRLLLEPGSFYFYRKHDNSISYRLRETDIAALIAADNRFADRDIPFPPLVQAALKRRRRTLRSLQAYDTVITTIKRGDYPAAVQCAVLHPYIWPMLIRPITARLRRLGQRSTLLARRDRVVTLETLLRESASIRPSGASS